MSESNYSGAFKSLAEVCTKALVDLRKKDKKVCLMFDDPDSLGAALVCHFLLTATKGQEKSMKQYSAEKAIEMIRERRL